jgi:hypothetical protein
VAARGGRPCRDPARTSRRPRPRPCWAPATRPARRRRHLRSGRQPTQGGVRHRRRSGHRRNCRSARPVACVGDTWPVGCRRAGESPTAAGRGGCYGLDCAGQRRGRGDQPGAGITAPTVPVSSAASRRRASPNDDPVPARAAPRVVSWHLTVAHALPRQTRTVTVGGLTPGWLDGGRRGCEDRRVSGSSRFHRRCPFREEAWDDTFAPPSLSCSP